MGRTKIVVFFVAAGLLVPACVVLASAAPVADSANPSTSTVTTTLGTSTTAAPSADDVAASIAVPDREVATVTATSTTTPAAATVPTTTTPTSTGIGGAALTPDAAQLVAVAATAPSAPRSPVATAANASVKLVWVAPASNGGAVVDRYAVQRSTSATSGFTNIAFLTTTTYTSTGLSNGARYYFRVLAHNAAGWGPASIVVSAVPRTLPTAPRSPVATAANASVKLVWVAPASNGGAVVDRYAVQRSTSATSGFTNIAFLTTTTYTSTGLSNGARYYFRVLAHNAAGWGPASIVVSAVPRTLPTAPRSPVATAANASVKLVWVAPASNGGAVVDRYAVQRSTSATSGFTNIAFLTTTTYTSTGLSNGARYYFRVLAHNAAGWGPASIVVSAVPVVGPPTAPRQPGATPGDGSVQVTWLAPANNGGFLIDRYAVQLSTSGISAWTNIAFLPVGETSYLATAGMTNGVRYYFRVLAHNAAGWGPASAVVNAVPRTVPNAPRLLTASPGANSVNLSWQPPSSDGGAAITGYEVQSKACCVCDAASSWSGGTVAAGTSRTVTGLVNGERYCFRVRARNAAGWGPFGSTAVVSAGVPSPVRNCSISAQAFPEQGGGVNWEVDVTWSPPASSGGYPLVSYTVQVNDGSSNSQYTVPATQTSILGLQAHSGSYWAAVWARNSTGLGTDSRDICLTPTITIP